MSHIALSILHIAVISPALLYVAIMRGQLSPWIFSLLSAVAIVMIVYHGYKAFIKWKAQSPSLWVNLIHILFVAPLLLFIGSKGYDTPRWAFELLAMLGFASLGYHIYSIINMIQEMAPSAKKNDSSREAQD